MVPAEYPVQLNVCLNSSKHQKMACCFKTGVCCLSSGLAVVWALVQCLETEIDIKYVTMDYVHLYQI